MTQVVIRAIYEGGVFKPLESLELPEKQVVELHIQPTPHQGQIIRLAGSWAHYLTDKAPAFEEIEQWTHAAHGASVDRLLDQVGGAFDDRPKS